ncbi:hypothetical protein FUMI01_23210 [Flavobacterium sp. UMI-01]|nr:hypothetical protein FUMI01_23210 [Flavobacterium sp. UMI-01]
MQNLYKILHTTMSDKECLKIVLSEIEKKLNWEDASLWKESDYIKLTKMISESASISISPHTLKRLFGKIKYKDQYNPQQATKDALSIFLGYSNWDDFVADQKKNTLHSVPDEKKITTKDRKKKINFNFYLIVILVGIFSVAGFYWFGNHTITKSSYQFVMKDSVGQVPFTVPIHYDLSKVNSDSLYVDFNFEHPYLGKQIVKLPKADSTINFTYQIPGFYYIKLKNGRDTLCKRKVLVESKNWNSYFVPESKLGKFWLDTEIPQLQKSDGNLYFSPQYLSTKGFNTTKVYYLMHRLFKEFKIDGDNFELETRFKSGKSLGGITCYDFIIRLVCQSNTHYLNLMEEGCSQFASLKFGDFLKDGATENMSKFKMTLDTWNTLKITVKNKNVLIFLNGEIIGQGNYQQPTGAIVGIVNLSKGSGRVDYIRIKDLKTAVEFREDFD